MSEGDGGTLTRPASEAQVWYRLSVEEVERELETGGDGLTSDEVARRAEIHGPNEVQAERATPWWRILAHQFIDPLIIVLIVAAGVTLLLDEYTDTAVIVAVVILNAVIGFFQEFRAQKAMMALGRMAAPRAEVVRDGANRSVASRDLVPGDLVLLTSGAMVPADLRLIRVRELEVDESAFTGESVPANKISDTLEGEDLVPGDQTNLAFSGTVVTRGRGRGIVIRTGAETELGRIASAMREVGHTTTPLQRKVEGLGKWIGALVLLLTGIVVAVGFAQNLPLEEILVTAVALAVGTIPEGLPVVLTVTLAVGVQRMVRRRAIIRSLPAVETLGSTTVIGSDKTGTLTRNQMEVRAVWAAGRVYRVGAGDGRLTSDGGEGAGDEPADGALHETLLAGVLASEADPATLAEEGAGGDPTELALLRAAADNGIDPVDARHAHPELDVLPFESEQRFMATLHAESEENLIYLKGAPEAVLSRCEWQRGVEEKEPMDGSGVEAVEAVAHDLAAEGLRVLAMAVKRTESRTLEGDVLEGGFTFLGLQGMEDPVRPEAVDAVAAAQQAGIRVKMLTGDHLDTARAIGRQLGLGGDEVRALEGREIAGMDDAALSSHLVEVDVFARVAPEHKLRIVERLKADGEVVAVTGDGVNDAPALRAAHLGIAMGKGGTDVAREASDMVLADDNFATITAAVEEGRVVFANIRKVTFFLLSTGVAMPLVILAALGFGWPLPFIAVQILWINLVTNGLQDVALAFEPAEPGLLRRKPRPVGEGILTRRLILRLVGVGILISAGTLGVFWWSLRATGDVEQARSVAMTQMVVFQFFHVFNSRSLDRSVFRIPLFANRFLFLSILAAGSAQLMVLYLPWLQRVFRTVPLTAEEWVAVVLVGTTVVMGGELDKWLNRRSHHPLG